MKRLPHILSAIIFLSACSRAPQGAPAMSASMPPASPEDGSGTVTEYYEDGTVRERYTLKDGMLQGQYLRYYPSGDIESSSGYKDNLLDGMDIRYFESGNRVRSTQPYKAGRRDGPMTVYYPDGMVRMVLSRSDEGTAGSVSTYHQNGRIMSEMYLPPAGGRMQGIIVMYYDNGEVSEKYSFRGGEIDGPYESYYPDGSLRRKGSYRMGEIVGRWYFRDRSGNETTYDYD